MELCVNAEFQYSTLKMIFCAKNARDLLSGWWRSVEAQGVGAFWRLQYEYFMKTMKTEWPLSASLTPAALELP